MREHIAPRLARGGVLALNVSRQFSPALAGDAAGQKGHSDSSGGVADGGNGAGAEAGSVLFDGPDSLDGPHSLVGPTSLDGPNSLDGPTSLLDGPDSLLDGLDSRDGLAAFDGPEAQEGGARECLRPFLEAMSAAELCDGPGDIDGPEAQKVMCAEGVCGGVRGGGSFAGQVRVCVRVRACVRACVRMCACVYLCVAICQRMHAV